jgi:hypothetical protein
VVRDEIGRGALVRCAGHEPALLVSGQAVNVVPHLHAFDRSHRRDSNRMETLTQQRRAV